MFYFESFVIKSVKVAGKYIIYKDIQLPKLANISKVASVMKFLVSTEKGKALVNKDMHIVLHGVHMYSLHRPFKHSDNI